MSAGRKYTGILTLHNCHFDRSTIPIVRSGEIPEDSIPSSVFARSPRRLPGVFREAIQDCTTLRLCEALRSNPVRTSVFARSPRRSNPGFNFLSSLRGVCDEAIQDSLKKVSNISSISLYRDQVPNILDRHRTFSEENPSRRRRGVDRHVNS